MTDVRRLEEIVEIAGKPIDPRRYPDESFALLSFSAFEERAPEIVSGAEIGSNKTLVETGDVLFSKLNPRIPRVWLVTDVGDYQRICSTEFVPLRIKDRDQLLPEFLAGMCRAPQFLEPIQAQVRSSTRSHQRIRPAVLLDQAIPVPALEEQRRIVRRIKECLERVDEIHRLRGGARREASAVFPSLLAERFRCLAIGYPVATIDDVALETKYGTSRRCDRVRDGTPVLRITNVADGEINLDDLKFCNQLSESELPRLLLQDGDLLIVRTNGSRDLVGRCVVFHEQGRPYAYASYLIRIRPNLEKVHPQFLAFFLESTMGRDAIAERRRTSAGQYNINSKNLRTIPFPCPPIDVQRDLVEEMVHQRRVVNEVMAEQSNMEQQDEALHQAVLRKAFAGEL